MTRGKEKEMRDFGFFYYSAKQDKFMSDGARRRGKRRTVNYFKPLFGKPRRYTEWVSKFPFRPASKWNDLRFVGVGFYHHSETV